MTLVFLLTLCLIFGQGAFSTPAQLKAITFDCLSNANGDISDSRICREICPSPNCEPRTLMNILAWRVNHFNERFVRNGSTFDDAQTISSNITGRLQTHGDGSGVSRNIPYDRENPNAGHGLFYSDDHIMVFTRTAWKTSLFDPTTQKDVYFITPCHNKEQCSGLHTKIANMPNAHVYNPRYYFSPEQLNTYFTSENTRLYEEINDVTTDNIKLLVGVSPVQYQIESAILKYRFRHYKSQRETLPRSFLQKFPFDNGNGWTYRQLFLAWGYPEWSLSLLTEFQGSVNLWYGHATAQERNEQIADELQSFKGAFEAAITNAFGQDKYLWFDHQKILEDYAFLNMLYELDQRTDKYIMAYSDETSQSIFPKMDKLNNTITASGIGMRYWILQHKFSMAMTADKLVEHMIMVQVKSGQVQFNKEANAPNFEYWKRISQSLVFHDDFHDDGKYDFNRGRFKYCEDHSESCDTWHHGVGDDATYHGHRHHMGEYQHDPFDAMYMDFDNIPPEFADGHLQIKERYTSHWIQDRPLSQWYNNAWDYSGWKPYISPNIEWFPRRYCREGGDNTDEFCNKPFAAWDKHLCEELYDTECELAGAMYYGPCHLTNYASAQRCVPGETRGKSKFYGSRGDPIQEVCSRKIKDSYYFDAKSPNSLKFWKPSFSQVSAFQCVLNVDESKRPWGNIWIGETRDLNSLKNLKTVFKLVKGTLAQLTVKKIDALTHNVDSSTSGFEITQYENDEFKNFDTSSVPTNVFDKSKWSDYMSEECTTMKTLEFDPHDNIFIAVDPTADTCFDVSDIKKVLEWSEVVLIDMDEGRGNLAQKIENAVSWHETSVAPMFMDVYGVDTFNPDSAVQVESNYDDMHLEVGHKFFVPSYLVKIPGHCRENCWTVNYTRVGVAVNNALGHHGTDSGESMQVELTYARSLLTCGDDTCRRSKASSAAFNHVMKAAQEILHMGLLGQVHAGGVVDGWLQQMVTSMCKDWKQNAIDARANEEALGFDNHEDKDFVVWKLYMQESNEMEAGGCGLYASTGSFSNSGLYFGHGADIEDTWVCGLSSATGTIIGSLKFTTDIIKTIYTGKCQGRVGAMQISRMEVGFQINTYFDDYKTMEIEQPDGSIQEVNVGDGSTSKAAQKRFSELIFQPTFHWGLQVSFEVNGIMDKLKGIPKFVVEMMGVASGMRLSIAYGQRFLRPRLVDNQRYRDNNCPQKRLDGMSLHAEACLKYKAQSDALKEMDLEMTHIESQMRLLGENPDDDPQLFGMTRERNIFATNTEELREKCAEFAIKHCGLDESNHGKVRFDENGYPLCTGTAKAVQVGITAGEATAEGLAGAVTGAFPILNHVKESLKCKEYNKDDVCAEIECHYNTMAAELCTSKNGDGETRDFCQDFDDAEPIAWTFMVMVGGSQNTPPSQYATGAAVSAVVGSAQQVGLDAMAEWEKGGAHAGEENGALDGETQMLSERTAGCRSHVVDDLMGADDTAQRSTYVTGLQFQGFQTTDDIFFCTRNDACSTLWAQCASKDCAVMRQADRGVLVLEGQARPDIMTDQDQTVELSPNKDGKFVLYNVGEDVCQVHGRTGDVDFRCQNSTADNWNMGGICYGVQVMPILNADSTELYFTCGNLFIRGKFDTSLTYTIENVGKLTTSEDQLIYTLVDPTHYFDALHIDTDVVTMDLDKNNSLLIWSGDPVAIFRVEDLNANVTVNALMADAKADARLYLARTCRWNVPNCDVLYFYDSERQPECVEFVLTNTTSHTAVLHRYQVLATRLAGTGGDNLRQEDDLGRGLFRGHIQDPDKSPVELYPKYLYQGPVQEDPRCPNYAGEMAPCVAGQISRWQRFAMDRHVVRWTNHIETAAEHWKDASAAFIRKSSSKKRRGAMFIDIAATFQKSINTKDGSKRAKKARRDIVNKYLHNRPDALRNDALRKVGETNDDIDSIEQAAKSHEDDEIIRAEERQRYDPDVLKGFDSMKEELTAAGLTKWEVAETMYDSNALVRGSRQYGQDDGLKAEGTIYYDPETNREYQYVDGEKMWGGESKADSKSVQRRETSNNVVQDVFNEARESTKRDSEQLDEDMRNTAKIIELVANKPDLYDCSGCKNEINAINDIPGTTMRKKRENIHHAKQIADNALFELIDIHKGLGDGGHGVWVLEADAELVRKQSDLKKLSNPTLADVDEYRRIERLRKDLMDNKERYAIGTCHSQGTCLEFQKRKLALEGRPAGDDTLQRNFDYNGEGHPDATFDPNTVVLLGEEPATFTEFSYDISEQVVEYNGNLKRINNDIFKKLDDEVESRLEKYEALIYEAEKALDAQNTPHNRRLVAELNNEYARIERMADRNVDILLQLDQTTMESYDQLQDYEKLLTDVRQEIALSDGMYDRYVAHTRGRETLDAEIKQLALDMYNGRFDRSNPDIKERVEAISEKSRAQKLNTYEQKIRNAYGKNYDEQNDYLHNRIVDYQNIDILSGGPIPVDPIAVRDSLEKYQKGTHQFDYDKELKVLNQELELALKQKMLFQSGPSGEITKLPMDEPLAPERAAELIGYGSLFPSSLTSKEAKFAKIRTLSDITYQAAERYNSLIGETDNVVNQPNINAWFAEGSGKPFSGDIEGFVKSIENNIAKLKLVDIENRARMAEQGLSTFDYRSLTREGAYIDRSAPGLVRTIRDPVLRPGSMSIERSRWFIKAHTRTPLEPTVLPDDIADWSQVDRMRADDTADGSRAATERKKLAEALRKKYEETADTQYERLDKQLLELEVQRFALVTDMGLAPFEMSPWDREDMLDQQADIENAYDDAVAAAKRLLADAELEVKTLVAMKFDSLPWTLEKARAEVKKARARIVTLEKNRQSALVNTRLERITKHGDRLDRAVDKAHRTAPQVMRAKLDTYLQKLPWWKPSPKWDREAEWMQTQEEADAAYQYSQERIQERKDGKPIRSLQLQYSNKRIKEVHQLQEETLRNREKILHAITDLENGNIDSSWDGDEAAAWRDVVNKMEADIGQNDRRTDYVEWKYDDEIERNDQADRIMKQRQMIVELKTMEASLNEEAMWRQAMPGDPIYDNLDLKAVETEMRLKEKPMQLETQLQYEWAKSGLTRRQFEAQLKLKSELLLQQKADLKSVQQRIENAKLDALFAADGPAKITPSTKTFGASLRTAESNRKKAVENEKRIKNAEQKILNGLAEGTTKLKTDYDNDPTTQKKERLDRMDKVVANVRRELSTVAKMERHKDGLPWSNSNKNTGSMDDSKFAQYCDMQGRKQDKKDNLDRLKRAAVKLTRVQHAASALIEGGEEWSKNERRRRNAAESGIFKVDATTGVEYVELPDGTKMTGVSKSDAEASDPRSQEAIDAARQTAIDLENTRKAIVEEGDATYRAIVKDTATSFVGDMLASATNNKMEAKRDKIALRDAVEVAASGPELMTDEQIAADSKRIINELNHEVTEDRVAADVLDQQIKLKKDERDALRNQFETERRQRAEGIENRVQEEEERQKTSGDATKQLEQLNAEVKKMEATMEGLKPLSQDDRDRLLKEKETLKRKRKYLNDARIAAAKLKSNYKIDTTESPTAALARANQYYYEQVVMGKDFKEYKKLEIEHQHTTEIVTTLDTLKTEILACKGNTDKENVVLDSEIRRLENELNSVPTNDIIKREVVKKKLRDIKEIKAQDGKVYTRQSWLHIMREKRLVAKGRTSKKLETFEVSHPRPPPIKVVNGRIAWPDDMKKINYEDRKSLIQRARIENIIKQESVQTMEANRDALNLQMDDIDAALLPAEQQQQKIEETKKALKDKIAERDAAQKTFDGMADLKTPLHALVEDDRGGEKRLRELDADIKQLEQRKQNLVFADIGDRFMSEEVAKVFGDIENYNDMLTEMDHVREQAEMKREKVKLELRQGKITEVQASKGLDDINTLTDAKISDLGKQLKRFAPTGGDWATAIDVAQDEAQLRERETKRIEAETILSRVKEGNTEAYVEILRDRGVYERQDDIFTEFRTDEDRHRVLEAMAQAEVERAKHLVTEVKNDLEAKKLAMVDGVEDAHRTNPLEEARAWFDRAEPDDLEKQIALDQARFSMQIQDEVNKRFMDGESLEVGTEKVYLVELASRVSGDPSDEKLLKNVKTCKSADFRAMKINVARDYVIQHSDANRKRHTDLMTKIREAAYVPPDTPPSDGKAEAAAALKKVEQRRETERKRRQNKGRPGRATLEAVRATVRFSKNKHPGVILRPLIGPPAPVKHTAEELKAKVVAQSKKNARDRLKRKINAVRIRNNMAKIKKKPPVGAKSERRLKTGKRNWIARWEKTKISKLVGRLRGTTSEFNSKKYRNKRKKPSMLKKLVESKTFEKLAKVQASISVAVTVDFENPNPLGNVGAAHVMSPAGNPCAMLMNPTEGSPPPLDTFCVVTPVVHKNSRRRLATSELTAGYMNASCPIGTLRPDSTYTFKYVENDNDLANSITAICTACDHNNGYGVNTTDSTMIQPKVGEEMVFENRTGESFLPNCNYVIRPCESGWYVTNTDHITSWVRSCTKKMCQRGQYWVPDDDTTKEAVCETCPPGRTNYGIHRNTTCVEDNHCGRNEFSVADLCYECPSGRYQRNTSHIETSCDLIECQKGTFFNATTSNCENCPQGQFRVEDGAVVDECTPYTCGNNGTLDQAKLYAIGNHTEYMVPEGEYCENAAWTSGPVTCNCGEYVKEGACKICPRGQYQPSDGHSEYACINASGFQTTADKCSIFNSSTASSTVVRVTCGLDQYYNIGDDNCQPCPENQVRNLPVGVTEHTYTSCDERDCNSCQTGQWCERIVTTENSTTINSTTFTITTTYNTTVNTTTCRDVTDCEKNVCNALSCNICLVSEATDVTDSVCGPCSCEQLRAAWNSTRRADIKNQFNTNPTCRTC